MKPMIPLANKIFCLFLTVWFCIGCRQSSTTTPASPQSFFKTPFQDETQFLVTRVVTDLAQMACYAHSKTLPPTNAFKVSLVEQPDSALGKPTYVVSLTLAKDQPPVTVTLRVNRPLWSAELYEEMTRALLSHYGIPRRLDDAPLKTNDNLLGALAELSAESVAMAAKPLRVTVANSQKIRT